jgi:hypothetical protein
MVREGIAGVIGLVANAGNVRPIKVMIDKRIFFIVYNIVFVYSFLIPI